MSTYERPRVHTLNSSQIVEMMGPAQGYNGSGGNSRDNLDTTSPGGFVWNPTVR